MGMASGRTGPRGVHERPRAPRRLLHAARRFGRHLRPPRPRRGMQLRNGLAWSAASCAPRSTSALICGHPPVTVAAPKGRPGQRRRRSTPPGRRGFRGPAASCSRPAASRTTRPPPRPVPRPTARAVIARPGHRRRRRTRLGETAGGRCDDARGARCLVPGVAGALPDGRTGRFPHIIERGKPGIIGVLAHGRRFCNEGTATTTTWPRCSPLYRRAGGGVLAVRTRAFQRRYARASPSADAGAVAPYMRVRLHQERPDNRRAGPGLRHRPGGLERTVAEYNRHARRGEDPAFGRGIDALQPLRGDPTAGPNPSLAPIERGPFYAVKVVPGSFGTFAGLKTDARARVLDATAPIPASTQWAPTWRASWAGTTRPAGSISGRR